MIQKLKISCVFCFRPLAKSFAEMFRSKPTRKKSKTFSKPSEQLRGFDCPRKWPEPIAVSPSSNFFLRKRPRKRSRLCATARTSTDAGWCWSGRRRRTRSRLCGRRRPTTSQTADSRRQSGSRNPIFWNRSECRWKKCEAFNFKFNK